MEFIKMDMDMKENKKTWVMPELQELNNSKTENGTRATLLEGYHSASFTGTIGS